MMNEEEYLNSKMGRRNPFTVPEGYFEQLTAQVMERLPQAQIVDLSKPKKPAAKVAVMKRIRPWLYAAACLFVGVFIAAMVFNNREDNTATQRQAANMAQQYDNAMYYSDNYIDEEADYAMVDNQEIYACLLAEM